MDGSESVEVTLGGHTIRLTLLPDQRVHITHPCPQTRFTFSTTDDWAGNKRKLEDDFTIDMTAQHEGKRRRTNEEESPPEPEDAFSILPVEIIQHILLMLPLKTVIGLNLVCKHWNAVLSDDTFWRSMFDSLFGCPSFLLMSWKTKCLYTQHQCEVMDKGKSGEQLVWAAWQGYHRKFESLRKMERSWNLPTRKLYRLACTWGHLPILKSLLTQRSYGITVMTDASGKTPLMTASKFGHLNIAEDLLKDVVASAVYGGVPNVDAGNHWGKSALMYAAQNGHRHILELLLTAGNARADIVDHDGETALSLAASEGHADIVKRLLPLSPPTALTSFNCTGHTPLTLACMNGHREVVELLLQDPSVNVNAVQAEGNTALIAAVEGGHVEIVRLLLGDEEIKRTADSLADSMSQETELPQRVVAELEKTGVRERTAFAQAVEVGNMELVKYLLSKGANPDPHDEQGRTPLFLAIKYGYLDLINLLLNLEAVDPNHSGSQGDTPLLLACRYAQPSTVEKLLSRGAKTHMPATPQNGERRHVFIEACLSGDPSIVKMLMPPPSTESPVDWYAFEDNFTPLAAACDVPSENLETVEYLLSMRESHPWLDDGPADLAQNALGMALGRGHEGAALLLLANAQVSQEAKASDDELLPFRGAKAPVVRVAGSRGVVVDINSTHHGSTSLRHAVTRHKADLTARLLELGADITEPQASYKYMTLHQIAEQSVALNPGDEGCKRVLALVAERVVGTDEHVSETGYPRYDGRYERCLAIHHI